MENTDQEFLTKDDKIDILNRMDAHFKWLVAVMISAIGLATVLGKLL